MLLSLFCPQVSSNQDADELASNLEQKATTRDTEEKEASAEKE